MKICNKITLALIAAAVSASAQAYVWSLTTTISAVEPTYMPATFYFQTSPMPANCPPGYWLYWTAKGSTENEKFSNSKAVMAAIMTAQAASVAVGVYGTDCQVEFFHLLN